MMNSFERNTHSFIVKIWLERAADGQRRALWRGYITHVHSRRRQYFQDLDTLIDFIAHYLETMGVRTSLGRRLIRWIRRVRSRQYGRP